MLFSLWAANKDGNMTETFHGIFLFRSTLQRESNQKKRLFYTIN